MSMSKPIRPWWHIGIASGIPLLALALGTGEADARSIERDIGSGASQKPSATRTAAPETRKAAPVEAKTIGGRNHDPCCADEPPVPRTRVGAPTTGSSEAPATLRPQPTLRGTSPSAAPATLPGTQELRPTGPRTVKRAGEAKPAPRSKPGEQRRVGPGALIGITFA